MQKIFSPGQDQDQETSEKYYYYKPHIAITQFYLFMESSTAPEQKEILETTWARSTHTEFLNEVVQHLSIRCGRWTEPK